MNGKMSSEAVPRKGGSEEVAIRRLRGAVRFAFFFLAALPLVVKYLETWAGKALYTGLVLAATIFAVRLSGAAKQSLGRGAGK